MPPHILRAKKIDFNDNCKLVDIELDWLSIDKLEPDIVVGDKPAFRCYQFDSDCKRTIYIRADKMTIM